MTESHQPLTRISYFLTRKLLAPIIKKIWIKKVTGLKNIPKKGPIIVAFNHQSFFDFICFSVISPRNIHYLAAEKFFTHKVLRYVMFLTGQIRVNRLNSDKSDVHSAVSRHLSSGLAIGIFPEGTRSPHKHEMLKGFTGIAKYAISHKVPIVPVGIIGTYDVMSKHDRKPKFSKEVEIHVGEPIFFSEHYNQPLDQKLFTLLTEKVMKKIEKLSGKVYPHYENDHS